MTRLRLEVISLKNCSGCELMRRKTLSHPDVRNEIQSKWDIHEEEHVVADNQRVLWYPTTYAHDEKGGILRIEEGFIPAYEFIVFLRLAQAQNLLRQHEYEASQALLEETRHDFSASGFVPECLYYIGIASHLNQNPRATAHAWRSLREHYGDSVWAHKVMLQWPPMP